MHRNNILDLLNNYHPCDEAEIKYKKEMINFVVSNEHCFQRSNQLGHMTASGWLLNQSGDMVLLMHHKKLNEWYQFGGHADGDFDLLQVAIKETQEESGIFNIAAIKESIFDIDIHYIPEYKGVPPHMHYDVRFLLQMQNNQVESKNDESIALGWFSKNLEDFPNHSPSMMRMFKKWLLIENKK
jgi:8-oxo-dGTP pyrophosphatase MutT (NUDIX family)